MEHGERPLTCISFLNLARLEQTNPVRGMKDRFGEENRRLQWIVEKGGKLATLYGFDQVLQKTNSGTAIACQRGAQV